MQAPFTVIYYTINFWPLHAVDKEKVPVVNQLCSCSLHLAMKFATVRLAVKKEASGDAALKIGFLSWKLEGKLYLFAGKWQGWWQKVLGRGVGKWVSLVGYEAWLPC